jgi:hypothetical protein
MKMGSILGRVAKDYRTKKSKKKNKKWFPPQGVELRTSEQEFPVFHGSVYLEPSSQALFPFFFFFFLLQDFPVFQASFHLEPSSQALRSLKKEEKQEK